MRVDPSTIETLTVPVLTVRGIVSFPNTDIRLEIGRLPSIEALEVAEANGTPILLLTQKQPSIEAPETEDLLEVGTLAKVTMKIKMPNGHYKVKFRPIIRASVEEFHESHGLLKATVTTMPDILEHSLEEEALCKMLLSEVSENANNLFSHPHEVKMKLDEAPGWAEITDIVAFYMRIPEEDKIKYLSAPEVKERLSFLLKDIQKEKQIVEMEIRINQEVKRSVDEHQKEFYLREKIRAIHKELGEENTKNSLVQQFKEKVKTLGMPEAIEEKTMEEIQRFEVMPANSSESGIVRTYIEWLLDLPWSKQTLDNTDLAHAGQVLENHHYGLEKVKDRIIEYLAVKAMTGKNPQTILCLVGPPGVGKTSLAHSIAEALDRKFVKISLGGVKDESEIRGHRRTYLGALPGRLIQGMKKAGTVNPVFLLDEIDKMSSDYKGDPASAMLEVLDPEQNSHFSDHYLEEEYDLSKVLFIATANYLENIPAPLKDRMDIIDVASYTEQEKFQIANRYLISRQMKSHGLEDEMLVVDEDVLWNLIRYYTREAGVRQLERLIGALCRKATKELLIEKKETVHITQEKARAYLGARKFDHGLIEKEDQVGVVTGLAYTQFGGDILPVEVTYYKGTGKTVLTGKLGDVMKESAQTAVSYVRANALRFNIDEALFKDNDIHIHVPEGAVPKDGPSAGITITTAVISALTGRSVRREVGMTGEVTLRGRVLPIGGLKEKSISAHRSGLTTIIMPKDNEKDLEEIPESVKSALEFIPVATIDEVLNNVLR